ncbi:MAG: DUF342 domain-containing protein [Lachnotalea sp.]
MSREELNVILKSDETLESEGTLESKVKVIVSDDKIEAYLMMLGEITEYDVKDIVELLNHHNVIYGIDKTRIAVMLNEKELNSKVLVAKGKVAIQGSNGYYKYYFNTEPVTNTIILEDGTVDYNTLGKLELCKENDLLVEYHPVINGSDGITVTGVVLKTKGVVDLRPLKGKGFSINESDNCYYSDFDGKIEFDGAKLKVSQVYVVEGDLDANAKPIKFYGDVLVQGNVFGEAKIEACGNITINGSVETATLIASKNILLKNGMQGQGKGYVFAKGDVSAKFFEQTTVVSKGNVFANSIMNCDINAHKKIIVTGRRGAIIGGNCRAIELISASAIGNVAEMCTRIVIGMDKEFYDSILKIDARINGLKSEITVLESNLNRITDKINKKQDNYLVDVRNNIMKEKIEKSAKYNEDCKLKEELISQKERSLNGSVFVSGRVFPNTNVCINGVTNTIRDIYRNVTLLQKESEIKVYSNLRL